MASKREEERNEKIIRGLMKLPPNRRCINCNSMGPQYVCTNFWSFVCMTCSGIHREFTHRVKSVSMAKFTSQEVEALQNGGNQRAREIYLKNWDLQRQRLPDSSNADKIRQFIKDVYVDKRYAVGQTSEKPPRDTQNRGVREDDTRRASSYHSFSQSPPYDYQYEDRRYGKQAGSLTRKPGSDRGSYKGKMSSFVYSPGRASERTYDDGFSNEGSISRVSDYSASSAGDPFRSGTQSPNFQKDTGLSSPPFPISRDASSEDVRHREIDSIPQRSRSVGSFGSIDSNFMSQAPFNSAGFTEAVSESEQPAGTSDSFDFFKAQAVPENVSSAAPIDLFQLPEAPAPSPVDLFQAPPIDLFQLPEAPASLPVDLFQAPLASSAFSVNAFQPVQASTTLDLFAFTGQPQSSATSNEGWATFDMPQSSAPTLSNETINPTVVPSDTIRSLGDLESVSTLNTSMQWPSSQESSLHPNLPPADPTNTQVWNAFEDPLGEQPLEGINQDSGVLVGSDMLSSTANQRLGPGTLESSGLEHFDWTVSHGVPPCPVPSSLVSGPPYIPPVLPPTGETEQTPSERKSNNPFDLPYDSQLEENDMFMDITSLHAALPNDHLSSGFVGDVSQPWFPQNSASPYIPAAGQGGATYLIPQAPSPQIQNVSTQGSLASIGGNPFA